MSASADTIPWNANNRSSYGPQLLANGMSLTGEFFGYSPSIYVVGLGRQYGEARSPIVTATCTTEQLDQPIAGNTSNCSRFQGYDCDRPASKSCCDPLLKGSLNTTPATELAKNRGYSWNSDGFDHSATEDGPCYATPGAWKFGQVGTDCVNPTCTTADLSLAEPQLAVGGVSPTLDTGAYNFLFATSTPPWNGAGADVVQASDGSYAVVAVLYDRASVMASPQALQDWQNNYGTAVPATAMWPTATLLDDYHRMMYDLAMQPYAFADTYMTTVCPIFAPASPYYAVLNKWYQSLPQAWREGVANDYCGLYGSPTGLAPTDDSCRCWQAGNMISADPEDLSYRAVLASTSAGKMSDPGDKNCWFMPCFESTSSNGPSRFSTPQTNSQDQSTCPPLIDCNNIILTSGNTTISGSVVQQSVNCQGSFSDGSANGSNQQPGGPTKPASSPLAALQAWAKAHWQLAIGLGLGALLLLGLIGYVVYRAASS